MQFIKKIWDDIRPNLVWLVLTTVISGSVVTAIISWVRAQASRPVTTGGAAVIFVIAFFVAAIGFVVYLVREKRKKEQSTNTIADKQIIVHRWLTPAVGIFIIVLIGWIVMLQRRVTHLEVEMVRYVLPRHLTTTQISVFGNYLRQNSTPHEVRIKYIMGDFEAQDYVTDISMAFLAGNWLPMQIPVIPSVVTCRLNSSVGTLFPLACSSDLEQMMNLGGRGLSIDQTGPSPPPPATLEEKLHPKPLVGDVVAKAFQAAGLPVWGGNQSLNDDPVNTLTVSVGLRPRNSHGIEPPSFLEKHLHGERIPDAISDDDF